MGQVVSYRDSAQNPEAYYQGLLTGLTASLYYNKNYKIQSSNESGYDGHYDYMILSHDSKRPTIIIELKRITATKKLMKDIKLLKAKLTETAQAALHQISQLDYLSQAKKQGAKNIIKMGLAFCGKRFKIGWEREGVF